MRPKNFDANRLPSAWLALVAAIGLAFAGASSAQPMPGPDTMVVATPAVPNELDPDFGESSVKGNIIRQVLDTPVWYDEDGVLHGWIFESWELLDDNRRWRFSIREGLEFDSGTPVNAETVKYTFDRMVDEDMLSQGADNQFPLRVGLVDVEIVDEHTLDIVTEDANAVTLTRLYVVYLLDPDFYEDASLADAALTARGSGPYRIVTFVPDDYVVFERNEDYWLGPPEIERLVVRAVPERSSRVAMLETGEVDIALDLAPDDIPIVEGIPNVELQATVGSRRIGLAFNQQEERFQDKRVRQAFNYAVDFDEINDALLYGLGGRATTYRGTDYCANPELEPYSYDPELAVQLLEDAGYDMSEEVVLNVASNAGYRIQVVEAMASQLRSLGIAATANVIERSIYVDMVGNRDFDGMIEVGLGGRGVPPQDAGVFLFGAFWNPTSWEDDAAHEFNDLLAEIQAAFDEDVVCDLTKELEAIAYEHAPWLFSHHSLEIAGVHERVDWSPRIDSHLFWRTAGWAD